MAVILFQYCSQRKILKIYKIALKKEKIMKAATIIGIILIVVGVLGFIFKGISFTKSEEVVDLGPVEIESQEEKTIPVPEILSGVAIVGGIVLVAVGAKKK